MACVRQSKVAVCEMKTKRELDRYNDNIQTLKVMVPNKTIC